MQEHEKWLKIVELDLKSAKALCKQEVFSNAVFYCQQRAEKALKSYLVFKNQSIEEAYDLMMLVELCSQFDQTFEKLYDDAEYLNPLSTKFRYPTEFDMPDAQDTKDSIKRTKKIVDFVLKKISK